MNSTMIIRCPHCSEKMSVPLDYAGLESTCPKCRKGFVMSAEQAPAEPAPRTSLAQPPAIPHSAVHPHPASKSQNVRVAGWICLSVGMVLLVLCPIIPFYSPFFLVSFVLAIVLLVRDEGRGGLALLLTTLLVPAVVGAIIFVLGVGAMMAAFTGLAKDVDNTPIQTPAAQPLPAREVSYDGLLTILNKYSDEYNRATTTVQKKDVRGKAQKEVAAFVENARMTLEGKVRDVQFGDDSKAGLSFSEFAAPGSAVQANRNLSAYSAGKLPVAITREEALAIKPGQKVRITGRPFVVARDNIVVTMLDEGTHPSLIMFRFLRDYDTLLSLRIRDYTVSFDEKPGPAGVPAKKNTNYLIVVPPKTGP